MSQTNTWKSAAWFKAGKEHMNNVKSTLPTATTQTGINFVATGAFAATYSYETPVLEIPGQAAAWPAQQVKKAAAWPVDKIGERQAVQKSVTVVEKHLTVSYLNADDSPQEAQYKFSEKDQNYQFSRGNLESLQNRQNQNDSSTEWNKTMTTNGVRAASKDDSNDLKYVTIKSQNIATKNKQTEDWQAVGKFADKASNAAVKAGTGIGLYALSNGITTAGNSLIEGEGLVKSLGNGLNAGKNSLVNAAYGIGEGTAAAVNFGMGSALWCFEKAQWIGGMCWHYTAGQLPHDEQPSVEVAGDAQADI